MRILIRNGFLIDPKTKKQGIFDLLTENDRILQIAEQINMSDARADRVIEAKGKHVLPGFIDLHVHFRDPGFTQKETIESGSKAAAAGGYTTVCPMPNTKPATDSKETILYVKETAEKAGFVRVLPVGAVTRGEQGEELTDVLQLKEAGAVALSEDGKSVMNPSLYAEGMKRAAEVSLPVFAHCEEINLVRGGVMNEGEAAKRLGLKGISNAVEDIITMRDILLAKETGARLHLCHCSTKFSVDFVRFAKENGIPVTAEVCPHHFTLYDDEIPADDANYKMNPPVRSREDRDALIKGLLDGTMEIISTDHAPHTAEEKSGSMKNAPFGIVGLETAYALANTVLVRENKMTPMQLASCMSLNPAKVLGKENEFGGLFEGGSADITITDPSEEYEVNKNEFLTKGRNTPFDKKKVVGRVHYTICRGKVTYEKEINA